MTGAKGKLPMPIRKKYIAIIEFSISYYESCPERSIDDYIKRTGRDIKSEWFPNMPLRQQKAVYFANIQGNAKDYQEMMDEAYNKLFPELQKLSAGLFLITCCCKDKRIYGFKKWSQEKVQKYYLI